MEDESIRIDMEFSKDFEAEELQPGGIIESNEKDKLNDLRKSCNLKPKLNKLNKCNLKQINNLTNETGVFNAQIVEIFRSEEKLELTVSDSFNSIDVKINPIYDVFIQKGKLKQNVIVSIQSLEIDFSTKTYILKKFSLTDLTPEHIVGKPKPFLMNETRNMKRHNTKYIDVLSNDS